MDGVPEDQAKLPPDDDAQNAAVIPPRERLRRLDALKVEGVLTDAEYQSRRGPIIDELMSANVSGDVEPQPASSAFCSQCGTVQPSRNSNFCWSCGNALSEPRSAASVTRAAPAIRPAPRIDGLSTPALGGGVDDGRHHPTFKEPGNIAAHCPSCDEPRRFSSAGDVTCPGCGWDFEIDDNGEITEGYPIGTACPHCKGQVMVRYAGAAICPLCREPFTASDVTTPDALPDRNMGNVLWGVVWGMFVHISIFFMLFNMPKGVKREDRVFGYWIGFASSIVVPLLVGLVVVGRGVV